LIMIDFRLSEDQAQLVSAVVSTLQRAPIVADPPAWSLDAESQSDVAKLGALGWIGIAAPESCGGSAATLIEEALIAREYGRWLVAPDVVATAMAATLAFQSGDSTAAQAFVEGTNVAAFAMPTRVGAGRGTGNWTAVQAAGVSHYVLLNEKGPRMARANGALIFSPSIDPSLGTTSITDTDLTIGHDGPVASDGVGCRILVLVAAMLAGIAEASRDLAVEYAKARKQFGRLIGSFQAIKHHCADMHVRARMAYSQALHASMLIAARAPNGTEQACAAFEVAAAAAVRNAEVGIQIHGAMGFSAECVAHRFLKRAHVLRIIGGSALAIQPPLITLLRRQA
jgi:alkylation response protein AidB-like acyl-CoA dehydrogenase